MARENHSAPLEDNRFLESKIPKKKNLPLQLHWFLEEDYLSKEILGVYNHEVEQYRKIAENAYQLFVENTDKVVKNNELIRFGIPQRYHDLFHYSWNNRDKQPFLTGRFDINGVLNRVPGKVIEFNADTCSTLPETIFWQRIQCEKLGKGRGFNFLEESLEVVLKQIFDGLNANYQPVFLGSSLGYPEDVQNVNTMLNLAGKQGFHPVYRDLPDVIFSEEGIFLEAGDDYTPVDVLFKLFPWDWVVNEEPELGDLLRSIILNEHAIVLNPFFTMLWQNKRFLSYISEQTASQDVAKTYSTRPSLSTYVEKPIYGRIGENVRVFHSGGQESSQGDYAHQSTVFQEYVENPIDQEDYTYQAGMFMVAHKAVALNYRTSKGDIITDDCEYFTHVVLDR